MELRMVKLSDFLTPINYCHPNNCGQARRHVNAWQNQSYPRFPPGHALTSRVISYVFCELAIWLKVEFGFVGRRFSICLI
jgi:hypothetical protein